MLKRRRIDTAATTPTAEPTVTSSATVDGNALSQPAATTRKQKAKSVLAQPKAKVQKKADPSGSGSRYINKQRCLIVCSRGISQRDRHLMKDLLDLLPHSKKDVKIDSKNDSQLLNEVTELNNCNSCIYLESRKHKDLYMWMSRTPTGPSVKFQVQNVHTMAEMKLTGNCMKGSRPLLIFDQTFDRHEHYKLLKEMFVQAFGTPRHHPKSKPFIDRVVSFFVVDHRIWFRTYQIVYTLQTSTEQHSITVSTNVPSTVHDSTMQQLDDAGVIDDKTKGQQPVLVELGPRFVLNPIRIFSGSFGGPTLWTNTHYTSPNAIRHMIKAKAAGKYEKKIDQQLRSEVHRQENVIRPTDVERVFDNSEAEDESDSEEQKQEADDDDENTLDDIIISDDSDDE